MIGRTLSLLALAASTWSSIASAGGDRHALLEAARQAQAAGDHQEALRLALAADALRSTSSLTRFLAEEYEALGKLPEAFEAGRRCLRLAENEAPSENHDAVLVGCRDLVADVRPRVALLAVVPTSQPPSDLRVWVGGELRDVGAGAFAVAPGTVRVEARARGRKPFATVVDATAGGEATVALTLEADVILAPTPPPPMKGRPVALVGPLVAGAGVLALGAAGITQLVSNGKYDALRGRCPPSCTGAADDQSTIQTLDNGALGMAIGGAALLALGGTLFVLDRTRRPGRAGTAFVGAGPGGAFVAGRF